MKKIKIIVAAIIRAILLFAPGLAFAAWQWGKVAALINILATVGVETLFLLAFAIVSTAIHTARDEARRRAKVESDPTESLE